MPDSSFSSLKLVICWLGVVAILLHQTESHSRVRHRGLVPTDQTQHRMRRDILKSEMSDNENDFKEDQENNLNRRTSIRKKSQENKIADSRKRCLMGSLNDCYPELADPLDESSSPWGWRPGPLYPEYGPHFPRGGMGHWRRFGYHRYGMGYPFRAPGCSCGCNNDGWNYCGGCDRNNWMLFNDAVGNSPGLEKTHNKLNPSQLLPFLGKPNGPSPPLKINSGKMKSAEHGSKRFDVTYNTGDPSGMAWSPNTWSPNSWYPCDPSYVNWPCQTPSQQSSISDQVVGNLFLWRPNGNASSSKHSTVRPKRR